MGSVGARATSSRTLIAVMAVCATHRARSRPGRDQAGDVAIFPHGFDGVERLIGDAELKPLVRFRHHAIYA